MSASTFPLKLLLLLLLLTALTTITPCHSRPPFACGPGSPSSTLPFCRASLPIQVRVRDLLSRLTQDEKVLMLVNNAAGSPRLGVARYEWWSEALHGVSNTGPGVKFGGAFPGATSFPQVITAAAAFNASLWESVGKAVSDEARAMYNGGQAGLSFWSPNINIFRDPRWGRGQETPGEDPLLAGKYAAAYVRGLQQPYAGNRLKLAACCKHYTAYDLDNWKGTDRFHFDARVTRQDLEDTFNVPFEVCVREGKAAAVMCSYNQVNGVPTCADKGLLLDTVRGQWGLAGYVVSDCDSVGVFYDQQHFAPNPAAAAADAIKAGLDLDCGPFLALHTAEALQQNLISMVDVDNALANTITVQMRLGMYDGDPARGPFGHLGPRDVCTPANQFLALEAARQGVVLLKNDRATLPFSPPRLRTVAVVGPNSDATVTMIGNYAGVPCRYTSPLQGISRYVRTVHQPGCTDVACAGGRQPVDAAVYAASHADATVLVAGLDQSIEAEARDRVSLLLPGRQQELVSKVAAASRGPVVLVLMCGGPVDITFAKNDPKISAILWVGYPGQAGGAAIADTIFGAFNPGGRLPMTWYPQSFVDRIPMTDMAMRANPARGYPGRTYRFYNGPIVYPFGHGLTYTSFRHTIAQAPASLSVQLTGNRAASYNASGSSSSSSSSAPLMVGQAVRVTHARCDGLIIPLHVDVANDGDRDGAHTLLVFSNPPAQAKEGRGGPARLLVAFEKVHIPANSQTRVELAIDVCKDLSFADTAGIRRIPIGEHQLQIGELTHSVSVLVDTSAHL